MRSFFLFLFLITPCFAQDVLESRFRMNGSKFPDLFPEAQKLVNESVVEIIDGEQKTLALGTVISASGHILTKASELPDSFQVRIPSGKKFEIVDIKLDRSFDLAVIKIDHKDLKPVAWSDSSELALGSWLSAPTMDRKLQVGIVSAKRREIKRVGGVIGVQLGRESEDGVTVARVMPNGGASGAGMEDGDVITHINDEAVTKRKMIIDHVSSHDAGETLYVRIQREDQGLELEVMLGHRSIIFEMFSRNQMMSGTTSKRRSGFKEIIQHDMFMEAASMGGPLMDIHGKVVGFNIAKANRVEIFALPSEVIRPVLEKLLEK